MGLGVFRNNGCKDVESANVTTPSLVTKMGETEKETSTLGASEPFGLITEGGYMVQLIAYKNTPLAPGALRDNTAGLLS